jgi:biopolymer transport protein ExbD
MRWPVLLLAALAAAGEPAVRLPQASEAAKAPPDGAVAVHLGPEGEILVDRDGTTGSVSLDQLATWLRARAEKPVVLRADENAPWRHVQWLMAACAEAKIRRVEFGVKGAAGEEGRMAVQLPAEKGSKPGSLEIRVAISIFVKKEEPDVWGPAQGAILRPVQLGYRLGDLDADEIEAARRYIRDACQAASGTKMEIVGEIQAAARVPHGSVVTLLNEYRRAGLLRVDFAVAARAATAEERVAARLAYPSR